ncbi:hypothetical protein D3C71_1182540 [compost metagenome]
MRGLLVGLAQGRIGEHTGDAVDALRRNAAASVSRLHLLDQLGLLLWLGLFLIDRGQFDVADVAGVERGLADFFHVIQMLVVGALGAIEQHLRQTCFRLAFGAPLADLLLGIHVGEAVRVLQVQHRQRDQRIAFARRSGFFQQGFGFVLFRFGGTGLGHQQTTEACLGARRNAGRGAVSRLGLFHLRRVMAVDLDIGQADLGFAVAQVCQLPVILRGGGGIATFERFVGQALVGQAGAAAEADRQG